MKKIIKKVLKKFLNYVMIFSSQETTITSSRVLPRNFSAGWENVSKAQQRCVERHLTTAVGKRPGRTRRE